MILTLTLNPSVDISYPLEQFHLDTVNRVKRRVKLLDKRIKCNTCIIRIWRKCVSKWLLGGALGQFIEEQLMDAQIEQSFFKIKGETRNCIAILHEGQQTEILEQGPTIGKEEAESYKTHLLELFKRANVIAMSGSLPKGLNTSYYADIVKLANKQGLPTILDSSGQSLMDVLLSENKPSVIKPNIDELSQLLDTTVTTDIDSLKEAVTQPIFKGIEWIIVSLGGDGAFAKHHQTFYKVNIPKIEVVNPVGSGDSTVAGIASGLVHQQSDEDLLKKLMHLEC